MEIDIVICTYNRATVLAEVLDALAVQRVPPGMTWSVVVVDNNSTDATAELVQRHVAAGAIPGLRRVVEHTQGLTHARLRGVRSTHADWIAFVDDDCILDDTWVAEATRFASTHPECGAFGSRVILRWEREPEPVIARYGWALAEQDQGDGERRVTGVAGAGMVVRREALTHSRWLERPELDDRVGARLVSGGDVEIAARVAGAGYELWYAGRCRLWHLIPAQRTRRRYVAAVVRGLGASSVYGQALAGPRSEGAWARGAARDLGRDAATLSRHATRALMRRRGLTDLAMDANWFAGRASGLWGLARGGRARRARLLGIAAPRTRRV
ncbi:glycosyltransferase [Miltoncostaea oceani]|uniref:glycosyltransferase n=1 Tax=Miltoncostaea oceani TaxID=2843216 RepID=UPI001C3C898E|nr:glycosyltransferase [Miltoncostaea oceani]